MANWSLKPITLTGQQTPVKTNIAAGLPIVASGGLRTGKRLAALYGALEGVLSGKYDRVHILSFENSQFYFRNDIRQYLVDTSFEKLENDKIIWWHHYSGRDLPFAPDKTCFIIDGINKVDSVRQVEYAIFEAETNSVVHFIEHTPSHKFVDFHGNDGSLLGTFLTSATAAGWTSLFLDETNVEASLTQFSKDYTTNKVPEAPVGALAQVNLGSSSTANTVTVTNDSGTDALIPAATQTLAGSMSAADKIKVDALNVGFQGPFASLVDLQAAVPVGQLGFWALIDDPLAGVTYYSWDTNTAAWIITSVSSIAGVTNLAYVATPTNGVVTSDTGNNATISLVDIVNAGLMSPADKIKVNSAEANAKDDQAASEVPFTPIAPMVSTNVQTAIVELLNTKLSSVNLSSSGDLVSYTIANTGGTDAVIQAATNAGAGVMTKAHVDELTSATSNIASNSGLIATQAAATLLNTNKLSGIEAGSTADQTAAEVVYDNAGSGLTAVQVQAAIDELNTNINNISGSTNLAYTPGVANGIVTSDTGNNATIPLASNVNAGLMTAAEKAAITAAQQNAAQVSSTAFGLTTSTNVQAALEELTADKVEGTQIQSAQTRTATTWQQVYTHVRNGVSGQSGFVVNVPVGNATFAGLISAAQSTKLAGIEPLATADQNAAEVVYNNTTSGLTAVQVQAAIDELNINISNTVGTANLAYTPSPSQGIVTSDTGTNATVPLADGTNAGLMSPSDFTKFAGVEAGATADQIAVDVPFTPAGNIASSDTQAAIEELDAEKVRWVPGTNSISVAAGGDIQAALNEAAKTVVLGGTTYISLAAGTYNLTTRLVPPQGHFGRYIIYHAAAPGGVVEADFVNDAALDETMLRSKYAVVINCTAEVALINRVTLEFTNILFVGTGSNGIQLTNKASTAITRCALIGFAQTLSLDNNSSALVTLSVIAHSPGYAIVISKNSDLFLNTSFVMSVGSFRTIEMRTSSILEIISSTIKWSNGIAINAAEGAVCRINGVTIKEVSSHAINVSAGSSVYLVNGVFDTVLYYALIASGSYLSANTVTFTNCGTALGNTAVLLELGASGYIITATGTTQHTIKVQRNTYADSSGTHINITLSPALNVIGNEESKWI